MYAFPKDIWGQYFLICNICIWWHNCIAFFINAMPSMSFFTWLCAVDLGETSCCDACMVDEQKDHHSQLYWTP